MCAAPAARFSAPPGPATLTLHVSGKTYTRKKVLTGESLINVRSTIPAKGTFTSKFTIGPKFSGSWNCHGVVWKGP